MTSIIASTKAKIYGTKNSWSLKPHPEFPKYSTLSKIKLEIQGSKKNGYHLVIEPENFCFADYDYDTLEKAMNDENEMFNIDKNAWKENNKK